MILNTMVSEHNVGHTTCGGNLCHGSKVCPRQAYQVVDHVSFITKCALFQYGGKCVTIIIIFWLEVLTCRLRWIKRIGAS